MRKLGITFLCAFGMMFCKQGELTDGIVTELPIAHQSEGNLSLSQADIENKKPSVVDKSKVHLRSGDAVKPSGMDKKVKDERVQGKKDESRLEVDVDERLQVPRKTAREVCAEFEARVTKYKSKLVNERNQFDPRYYSLSIPFKKISPIFTAPEQQADIYAALGSDVAVIVSLERILNNLDLKEPVLYTYGDTKVAAHLFNLLLNISDYTRKLVNTHLSSTNLERIKTSKSVEDIIAINAFLEKFMQERDRVVKIIQDQITSLSLKDKGDMLDGLKKTIGLKSGSDREIQRASYSIIGMVARIAYLVK
ncbi:hypothetical protein [Borrelia hermsii]|uniref:Uncharacterized protein n=2 Tax=Borrelia hermsii TaxID=140 RepID=T1EC96_BORHE|nr:hypothetical protein [Borrelia hermsii]ADN26309.1 hypothetical protein BHA057 [Borrelia hermsii]AMR75892.1 hypothetical protein A0V01_04580 [Borrelia hermsii]ANA43698.1 putative lipoprotein [Borrelia hermsii HS1]UPA08491.1 hypothetical protein bhDAH_001199 [Borrelia hermsii DAH]